MATLFDVDREALGAVLAGEPRFRVDQLWSGLHQRLSLPSELTELPKALRGTLADELPLALQLVAESVSSTGDTVKFAWALRDGATIETVLMLYRDRATVCVSSQAGCAMACGFCATGQAGFDRQLSVGEIVEQVIHAARRARTVGRRVSNVVFMGMGEPMANEERVWTAIERLHDDVGISARHLTISTVGIVPGIVRLASRPLPVNLAVSLHAANDRDRDRLVPINKRYPLEAVIQACSQYLAQRHRRVSFEWALIDRVNDRRQDAQELAELCHRLQPSAHVNLIPLNPTAGWSTRGSAADVVRRFRDWLAADGVNATVRRNRGTDIDAACGQLATRLTAPAFSSPAPVAMRRPVRRSAGDGFGDASHGAARLLT